MSRISLLVKISSSFSNFCWRYLICRNNKCSFVVLWSVLLVMIVILGGLTYKLLDLRDENDFLAGDLQKASVQIQDLEYINAKKDEDLDVHKQLLADVQTELRKTGQSRYEMQVAAQKALDAADIFNKLSETDEELLAKYSRTYFLNEHYTPSNLEELDSQWAWQEKSISVNGDVLPFLLEMLGSMKSDGLQPKIVSAYRSFGTQEQLKNRHEVTYGTTEANKFVADQGFSEHQLGTTVDITDATSGGLGGFDDTDEYEWLVENAYKYGFVLSYQEDNTYYAYEPWHWRFVGKVLASDMREGGKSFYDLPQREINSYLIKIFDN